MQKKKAKKKKKKKNKNGTISSAQTPTKKELLQVPNNANISTQIMDNSTQYHKNESNNEIVDTSHNEIVLTNSTQYIQHNNSCLWSGIISGGLVVLVFIIIAFLIPGFRVSTYYINEDPSLLTGLLTSNISYKDSINIEKSLQEEEIRRKDVIKDLLDQRVIVSSDVFASNLTGYYNTLVAVLAGILIILNIVGFFSWRSNANSSLEKKKNELENVINNIEKILEKNLEEVFRKNSVIKEKIQSVFEGLYDENAHLTEEEWEKLHLLLAKYKKEERLEEMNEDEIDGRID